MRWLTRVVGRRRLNLTTSKAIQVAIELSNERGLVSGVGALAEQLDRPGRGPRPRLNAYALLPV
jgi:hypothetical protein